VHDPDAGDSDHRRPEALEAQCRLGHSSDRRMVLLDDVVEEFSLADLDVGVMLGVVAFDRRRVGAALVDGDLPRNAIPAGGLGQEMQRRLAVAPSRAQEAHRGTALSTADTDTSNPLGPHVDPIHPSAATHRTLARQQRHVVDLHSPAPPSSPQSGGSSTDTSHTSEHPRDDVTLEAAAFELDCYRL